MMSLDPALYLADYRRHLDRPDIPNLLLGACSIIAQARTAHSKLVLAGNGASASISSHLAADFTKHAGVRAMAFNDANLITALANDCGYENWISKAIEFHSDPGDVVILISSSGRSPNIVTAAQRSKELGLGLVAFTGFAKDNPLGSLADMHFHVDSRSYNIIECVHMIWLTAVCDMLIGNAEYSVKG